MESRLHSRVLLNFEPNISLIAGHFQADWTPIFLLGFDKQAVGNEIIVMLFQGLALLYLLGAVDSWTVPNMTADFHDLTTNKEYELDSEIAREEKKVKNICSKRDFKDVTIVADNLYKARGSFSVVNGVSFSLAPQVGDTFN